ncbi:MAG TPA: DUF4062 domain-containing protein [Desulfobacteria bacterium]|nr:DUF4062 domain-containing protein [Desulfobacteria bacterium]
MKSKLQVFISSTYQDLIDERQAAVEAILKSGHIPAGMELFTAGDKSQWEVIQRWIIDSDIYMIILGGRYGSIEPNSGLSYIELEYDFAVSSGKPHFAVVIDEHALELKVKAIGNSVLEKDNPNKLKAFRQKVLSKMPSFFTDHKDVKLAVLETVPQLESEYKLEGWVRATEIPDTKALADELTRLHAENQKLREKLASQAKQIEKRSRSSSALEEEFAELVDLLSSTKVDVTTAKQSFENASDVPDEVSVLNLALSFKDMLMSGITNQIGMTDLQSFAFFTLCPKLQTYELVQNEKVAGVKYRRYAITQKGTQFFAYVEKMLHKQEKQPTESAASEKKASKKRKTANKTSGGDVQ